MPPKVPRVRAKVPKQKGQIRKDRQRLRDLFSRPEFVDWERTNGGFGPMRDKNSWVAALRVFNANNKRTFCTPRRGSPEYDAVKAIQAQFEAGAMNPKPNMPGKRFSSHSRIERIPEKRMSAAARAKIEKEREAELRRAATARQNAERDRLVAKYTEIARNEGTYYGERDNTAFSVVARPAHVLINAKPAGEKRRIALTTVV